jgi:4-diphosphocytidyl-2-C-methyl-D-erythritol kinase
LFPLVDAPRAWVVVVVPAFGVSTKDAFAWWDGDVARRRQASAQRRLTNDLQAVVVKRHPEIGRLVRALERAGASDAAMTGAGSAVFGLFSTRTGAQRAASLVSKRGSRTIVTRTVDRATCQALAVS